MVVGIIEDQNFFCDGHVGWRSRCNIFAIHMGCSISVLLENEAKKPKQILKSSSIIQNIKI